MEQSGGKYGNYLSGGAGGSIYHRGRYYGTGEYGSSSDVVVLIRRGYYYMEEIVENLEEEPLYLRG